MGESIFNDWPRFPEGLRLGRGVAGRSGARERRVPALYHISKKLTKKCNAAERKKSVSGNNVISSDKFADEAKTRDQNKPENVVIV